MSEAFEKTKRRATVMDTNKIEIFFSELVFRTIRSFFDVLRKLMKKKPDYTLSAIKTRPHLLEKLWEDALGKQERLEKKIYELEVELHGRSSKDKIRMI